MHPNLIKALDSGSLMKPNRRNSCTQITDGEVDTMITETENLTSEERHTGKNHKACSHILALRVQYHINFYINILLAHDISIMSFNCN